MSAEHIPDQARHAAFNSLVLEVFQLNGLLLAWGNVITKEHALTSALWQIMGAVAQGPLTQAGIARRMGLTRQSVRRTTRVLEERGLVAFEVNPDHKRAHLVRLTEQGREVLAGILNDYAAAARQVYQAIPREEMESAFTLLRGLCQRLNS